MPAAAASAPEAAASAVAAPVAVPASAPVKAPAPPPPPVETSLVDDLLENPIVPAAAGGLLALLLGFLFYRTRQKKSAQVDSSFLESRLQPDSFFGASGGQRIDTAEGASVTGSSMVYSPSQLDAAGDVDPVAEADVYLAYGRDLQAEEILKEALRTSPQRVAIHAKLLEIYAKRRDARGFEQVAAQAFGLTQGEGPEWEHIVEMGQELDPSNPMYKPGGQPVEGGAAVAAAAAAAVASNYGSTTATQPISPEDLPDSNSVDLDLDLDFSLGDDEPPSEPMGLHVPTMPGAFSESAAALAATTATPAPAMPSLDMDFGSSATVSLQSTPEAAQLDTPDLMLSENSLIFDDAPVSAPAPLASPPAQFAPAESGMIEFDMGALSLDLDKQAGAKPEGDTEGALLSTAGSPLSADTPSFETDFSTSGDDPLATKLALAEEFNAIGDPDGARSLAEEVVAEASGELKSRAQRFLTEIG